MKMEPQVAWRTAGHAGFALDARLLPLLRAIRARATLRAATDAVGLSYRAAWDLLGAQSRALGVPLVAMQRGRGAKLTALGERLLAADDEARRVLQGVASRLSIPVQAGASARLRCAASHDLLLAAFAEAQALALDISSRGSMEALAVLARGEADLAGFHLAAGTELLQPRRHLLVRFAVREQGLMVAKGNPKRLRGLADLRSRRVRFVNRQRGSGTRVLLDQLLAEAGVLGTDIAGYTTEEFTHLAVAATVAAGRADAGFGVRAAAARFGLDFLPLRRERYWLAFRRRDHAHPAIVSLLKQLKSEALQRLARQFPGYDAKGAGQLCELQALREKPE
jgi:molybdate transport repressor ModE-like protein